MTKDEQPSFPGMDNPPQKPSSPIESISFDQQIHLDQQRYSRYVCDSRAIPNVIDGLKPVQRRILWTMWNSSAKTHFTKTVKVAGMTMAYHPHGNASIEDAIASMTQSFCFANNYPLIEGEGTFGDILDPKAVASPRYTEVRISKFAHHVGLFQSLNDIDYVDNYDETSKEPIFFVPKVPLVLLNPTIGIATGFRCNIQARSLKDVVDCMHLHLSRKSFDEIDPWYRDFQGFSKIERDDLKNRFFVTGFGFAKEKEKIFLTHAPQNWNREKVIAYLEALLKFEDNDLRDYTDYSMDQFKIELFFSSRKKPTIEQLHTLFDKRNRESFEQYVINANGKLEHLTDREIIANFLDLRKIHLKRRFTRLAKLEKETIAREKELIRFIKEKWNERLVKIGSKALLEDQLKKEKFIFYQWLSSLPLYRLTENEVKKSNEAIKNSEASFKRYKKLIEDGATMKKFIREECSDLLEKFPH